MKKFLRFDGRMNSFCSYPNKNPRAIPPGISAVFDRQHRAVFTEAVGSSTASVSVSGPSILTVGSIKPHNASERFTAPHTVSNSFPSYSLPFQKERKQKRKEEKPPKTLENTRKKGKSRHRSSCNSANASGSSLG